MKTYLIAGSRGFIGYNLTRTLLEQGHRVIGVDDDSTGRNPKISTHHIVADVGGDCELPRHGIDYVINLACPASPPKYQKDPIHTLETCFLGTRNLLRVAQASGARFLQASTSEIYGDPLVSPQPESYLGNTNSMGPRACYDEGKRVAETLCYVYAEAGLSVRVARIFNTYGPHMDEDDGRVVTNFIKAALAGEDMVIYGSGDQTRSLCYIDDLVNGLLTYLHADTAPPALNLGNDEELSVNTIAFLVKNLTRSESRILHKEALVDDPAQRRPDLSKARSLGYSPQVSVVRGLRRYIDFWRTKCAS